MFKKTTLVICVSTLCLTGVADAQWSIQRAEDQMTGEVSCKAASAWTSADTRLRFPYAGVKAAVIVNPTPYKDEVYIVFTKMNLGIPDGNYRSIRVRFDNDNAQWFDMLPSGNALSIGRADKFIEALRAASKVLVEFPWYDQGMVYFRFDLSGSNDAILKAKTACGVTE